MDTKQQMATTINQQPHRPQSHDPMAVARKATTTAREATTTRSNNHSNKESTNHEQRREPHKQNKSKQRIQAKKLKKSYE